jgi:hypothetical protein
MVPDAIMESTSDAAKKTRILHDGELLAMA